MHVFLLEPKANELAELAAAFSAASADAEVAHFQSTQELERELAAAAQGAVVVIDAERGDGRASGEEVLAELRQKFPRAPLVLTAATGDVASARRAVAGGATDYLVRGAALVERARTLLGKVRGVLTLLEENRELLRGVLPSFELVGRSAASQRILQLIERVARVPRPVLVEGERGTGKELVARAIHLASRRPGVFVAINCATLAEPLLEAELFGYERGAFTGAERRMKGKFEVADGGTLFLDEVGHMPLGFQQKILRTVEYGTFLRVGSSRETKVDTRIVAATNADLRQRIDEGRFLPDLYDRLAFETIRVPPLRERPEDIAPLAAHFVERFVREVPEFSLKRLTPEAAELLRQYPFPGNVRELKNIIERAVYRETGSDIAPRDLEFPSDTGDTKAESSGSFKSRIESLEREMLQEALQRAGGNQAQAARSLGLSYHQFRYFHAKHWGK